VSGSMT